jgi:hypothetical protein
MARAHGVDLGQNADAERRSKRSLSATGGVRRQFSCAGGHAQAYLALEKGDKLGTVIVDCAR